MAGHPVDQGRGNHLGQMTDRCHRRVVIGRIHQNGYRSQVRNDLLDLGQIGRTGVVGA